MKAVAVGGQERRRGRTGDGGRVATEEGVGVVEGCECTVLRLRILLLLCGEGLSGETGCETVHLTGWGDGLRIRLTHE